MAQDNIQDASIEEFSMVDDWLDKYDYLISLSDTLPAMDPALRNEKNLIEGCQSRVWVSSEMRDGKMYYSADSDAIITKGIVALLVRVMSGRSAEEVATMELYFIDEIGLGENLSPTRSNGLRAMVKQMKLAALVLSKTKN